MDRTVKPSVGCIPASEPLPPTIPGLDFFEVELLVGSDDQVMPPFIQEKRRVPPKLSIYHYIASAGLDFAIRVRLAQPCQEGVLYGARVYIDSGDNMPSVVHNTWKSHSEASPEELKDETIDTAIADHYFWIPAGQQEHIIRGFYKSPSESCKFSFSKPQKGKSDGVAPQDLKQIGAIRIAFSIAEKTCSGFQNEQRAPKVAKIDATLERKSNVMAAKPGSVVQDGCAPDTGEYHAELHDEVIFEQRMLYNTYEGYDCSQYNQLMSFYQSLPLKVLLRENMRKQAVSTFLRRIIAAQAKARAEQEEDDDFVRVEDVVHYICNSLSPAASYILCVGKEKRGNYGEKVVQKYGGNGLQDYVAKEKGLVTFFSTHRGLFCIKSDGQNETAQPKENFKVQLVHVEVESDVDVKIESDLDE